MEQRFSRSFADVRIHADEAAGASADARGAAAYTVGRDIYFGPGRYAPGGARGRALVMHELAHVVQQTSVSTASGGFASTSALEAEADRAADPSFTGSVSLSAAPMAAQLKPNEAAKDEPTDIQGAIDRIKKAKELFFGSEKDEALRVLDGVARYLDRVVNESAMREKLAYLGLSLTGTAMVVRAARAAPASLASRIRSGYPLTQEYWNSQLSLLSSTKEALQIVVGERYPEQTRHYYGGLYASNEESVNHELASLFKKHVVEASTMTGDNGVPQIVLAAVLKNEMLNTSVFGVENPADARAEEIADVGAALKKSEEGAAVDPKDINHSIGPGQVKLSTAAQLSGMIPWRESHEANRRATRAKTEEEFENLDIASKKRLFRVLSSNRGGIITSAALLKRLKNRTNRYPNLTRAEFARNERAVKIIATEYNIGASDTQESDAKPTAYGDEIWKLVQSKVLKRNFSAG